MYCKQEQESNPVGMQAQFAFIYLNIIHYITLKPCLPIEGATSIPMDVQTQDKALITNHKYCMYKTTTKSYNHSYIGHAIHQIICELWFIKHIQYIINNK